jgi:thymidylate synthase (FAD)
MEFRGFMKVTLEQYTDPANLGRFAGICYGREGNDDARLAHIISVGHLSVLRFGHVVFRVEGISRVCLAQLTRSKHLDYLVRSSRYCDESEAEFIRPPGFDKLEDSEKQMIELWEVSNRQLYHHLRSAGMSKQDARFWLPQAQATELYVAGNYQAWKDFIKLRNTKHAQKEVRDVAAEIERQLQGIAPIIFGEQNAAIL